LLTFRRGRGEQAISAGIEAQIGEIANEPGVRQTT